MTTPLHVFLSYSRKDYEIASQISKRLAQEGLEVWVDASIIVGDNWQEAIEQALKQADVGVLLLSPSSLNSPAVAQEYRHFLKFQKPLIPVIVESIDWEELPASLRNLQSIDLTHGFVEGSQRLAQLIKATKSEQSPLEQVRVTLQFDDPLEESNQDALTTLITKLADAGFHDIRVKPKAANE